MKKFLINISVISVLVFMLVHTGVFAAEQGSNINLLSNGGFENGFSGWKTGNLNEDALVSSGYAYSGNSGFRICGASNEQYLSSGQLSGFDRDKSYELSAYVKADSLSNNGFYMSILGVNASKAANGWLFVNDLPEHKAICPISGTHSWKKVSYFFDGSLFDENTTRLQLYLFMPAGSSGEVWVDDVSLAVADLNVYSSFERFGNVIIKGEDIQIPVAAKNTLSTDVDIKIDYVIKNDFKEILCDGSQSFTAKANEDTTYKLPLAVTDCGVYDLEMNISAPAASYSKTEKTRFCIIMQDNSQNPADDFGLVMHCNRLYYHNATPDKYYGAFSTIGAGWIRDEIRWDNVEKVKGSYTVDSKIESMVAAIKKHNQKALIILGFGNTLYDMPTIAVVPTTEAQLEGWRNYVKFVVSYLKNSGITKEDVVFEVWNEYSGGKSNSTAVSAEHYVNLISIVREVVDEIMPGTRIMTEGMAHVTNGKGRERFETYCKTGAADKADIIGMHPYTTPIQPDEDNLFADAVREFRDILDENNLANRPFFHSEAGWPAYRNDDYGRFSEREGAISVMRLYTLNKQMQKKYNQQDVLFIYKGADQSYTDPDQNYGLLNLPWSQKGANSAKLAYVTFDAAVALLGAAEYAESLEQENLKIFKFRKGTEDVLVMWTENENEYISLKCGDDVRLYDMAGNMTNASVYDGSLRIAVTREPRIAVGEFSDITPGVSEIVISDYSKACLNGGYCYVTLQGNESLKGKNVTAVANLPHGWQWINSDDKINAGGASVLRLLIPESNADSKNRIIINALIDGVLFAELECTVEAVNSIYSENLIDDASFEEDKWSVSNKNYAMTDSSVSRTGKKSMKLTGVSGDGIDVFAKSPEPAAAIEKDEKYLMSGWVKAETLGGGMVQLVTQAQGVSWTQEIAFSPDTEWTKFSTIIDFSEEHAGEEFYYCFYLPDEYNGTVWIDDVELRRIRRVDETAAEDTIPEAEGNVIPDPSAEYGFWSLYGGEITNTKYKFGDKSIKLTAGDAVSSKDITVDYTQKYMLSAFVKSEKKNDGILKLNMNTDTKMCFSPRTEWIKYSAVVDFAGEQNAEKLNMQISAEGFSGTVWIDGITLVPIDERARDYVCVERVEDNTIVGSFHTDRENELFICAAVYENGVLKEYKLISDYDTKAGYNQFSIQLDEKLQSEKLVKLLVWDSIKTLKPLKKNEAK